MANNLPAGKTAIIVIHGIGEQDPFETLDSFARGFINHLSSLGMECTLHHELANRKGTSGAGWTESFVRIQLAGGKDQWIDIHEYYWAYLTEEKISIREVYDWITKTLNASRKFYKEDKELQTQLEKHRGNKPLPLFWLKVLVGIVSGFELWVKLLNAAITYLLPFAAPVSGWLRNWIYKKTRMVIVGYVGDVAIYTTMDQKSRHYRLRSQILKEAQVLFESVINENSYESVIVAGHSLGSVIAYDTLSKLNLKMNVEKDNPLQVDKITRLVTFGSPLDKIAFFFREHAEKSAYVRRQILGQLYSFRSESGKYMQAVDISKGERKIETTISEKIKNLRWINFHHKKDPISGPLDYYTGVENRKLVFEKAWGIAHNGYWDDPEFYRQVYEFCFTDSR